MKNDMTQNQSDNYARLQAQVEDYKKRKERGETLLLDNSHGMRNVVSVSECIDDIIPELEEMAKKWTDFTNGVKLAVKDMTCNCEEHIDVELEIDMDYTFGMTKKNDKLTVIWKDCPKCVEDKKFALVNEKWLKMGIPHKTCNATFDNFNTYDGNIEKQESKVIALQKVRKQVKKSKGFIIMIGKFGTGKTHLASAAIKEVGAGILVTEFDLVTALRQTYSDNTGQEDFLDKYRRTPILVLDELTSEVTGKDVPGLLYQILGRRYDEGKLTIITSNETIETVREIFGGRLSDRIRESHVVVNFVWDSARKPQLQ